MTKEKFEDYIYINKIYLRLIGLWPSQENDPIWKIYIHKLHSFIFTVILWFLLLVPMLLDVYIVWGNSSAVSQNLCSTAHILSVFLKYIHVATNQTVFKELLEMMEYNFDNSLCDRATDMEKNLILKHARFGRLVSKLFVICVYYFEFIMLSLPLIFGKDSDPARDKRYPLCAWYFNWDKNSDFNYAVAYFIQTISSLGVAVSFNLGMDTLVFIAIWHSCAHLAVLQEKLRAIGFTNYTSEETIKELVENHNYQIRNVKKLNKLFSKLCFYQIGISFVAICFSGFQIIVTLNETPINMMSLFSYIGLLCGNFFQILLFCWSGQKLMDQAVEVGIAAYQSFWTNLPIKSTKSLFLLILRTQCPIMISAGGFYDMTLQNFTAIVKINMSFLSVLRTMSSK